MFRFLLALSSVPLLTLPAGADVLKLANGDTLNGEIVDWAVDHVVIEHPQLGRVRLEFDQLAIDVGEEPPRGLFDTAFMRGWKRRIELGWNGRQGDETRINITAGLRFTYKDPFKRWDVNGRYFFQDSSDDDTDNNARLDVTRDWLFPGSRWFARLAGRYQFDEFESWQHRTILTAGPGYNLLKTERHTLDIVLSPTFTREYGDVNEFRSEGLVTIDWNWQIWNNISLETSNQLFTEIAPDGGDFRNFTISNLSIGLVDSPDLDLMIGIENEYESNPDPGDQANDLLYKVSIGLGF